MMGVCDDRVLRATRLTAALLVPILLTAFVILYFLPDETDRLFAWPVVPRLTAIVMGAGYGTGVYFFARLALTSRWHHAGVPLPGVATFAALLALTTALHWDRFNHGHIAFYVWVLTYGLTPPLVVVLWWRNRATDPRIPEADDLLVPPSVRAAMAAAGVILVVTALVMFVVPELGIAHWPWELSRESARATAGWVALPGAAALSIAADARWSAWRIPLEGTAIWAVLIALALPRAWYTVDVFTRLRLGVGVLGWIVAVLALYAAMEWRRRHLLAWGR